MKAPGLFLPIVCFAALAHATSIQPPSFDELVAAAELVFRGRVASVRTGWQGTGADERIATTITFSVDRVLKGTAPETLTLEFLGGKVGRRRLEVVGMPRFTEGDRGVFFVENRGDQLCPLVRWRHGRYRIVRDAAAATERVVRDDFTALGDVTQVGAPLAEQQEPRRAALAHETVTLADFEASVMARARALASPLNQPRR